MRKRRACDDRARDNANGVKAGQHKNVYKRHPLEAERVSNGEQAIARHSYGEQISQPKPTYADCADQQSHSDRGPTRDRNSPGSERAPVLPRMFAVAWEIQ